MAAAVIGMDLTFGVGRASSGTTRVGWLEFGFRRGMQRTE